MIKILKKSYYFLSFVIYYLLKIVQSNIYIAYDILTPRMHTNPGFVWVSLKLNSSIGILIFSNLLSMTPGTLSVDLSSDKKKLLVHYLYNDEHNTIINDIDKIQDRIIRLTS